MIATEINFDDFKVRCSAISKVMANSQANPQLTEKQAVELDELEKKSVLTPKQQERMAELNVKKANGSKVVLSEGCIEYLMEVYSWKTEGMIPVTKESMDILQMKKGKMQENDGITLLSFVKDKLYVKNDVQVSNDYLTGEPDVFEGEEIMAAIVIEDTKLCWDYPTFLKSIHKSVEPGYRSQVAGYCDITGAKEGFVSKCLVSAPIEILEEMKWKVAKKLNAISIESPDFLREWAKWERSMIFDSIDPRKRVFSQQIELFSDFEKNAIYDRVKVCREFLNNFHEQRQKLIA